MAGASATLARRMLGSHRCGASGRSRSEVTSAVSPKAGGRVHVQSRAGVGIRPVELMEHLSLNIDGAMVKWTAADRVRMLDVLDPARGGNYARPVRSINHDPPAPIQSMMDRHTVSGIAHVHDGAISGRANYVAGASLRFATTRRTGMTEKCSRWNQRRRRRLTGIEVCEMYPVR